ncbi:MAG TPA: hypothetical protein VNU93_05115, partial [Verrucomicrobiae bacterium]|nr:hypothetical protein [Verrucomicrobiae bacterium]
MPASSLTAAFYSTKNFVLSGITQITGQTPYRHADFLVSSAPVPTSLAVLALSLDERNRHRAIETGLNYLENARLPDGQWGTLPIGPATTLATAICNNSLNAVQNPAYINAAIVQSARLISQTWVMDFSRLAPEWLPRRDSPIIKLFEALIGKSLVPDLNSITLRDLGLILRYMPPYGRPNLLAITLIKAIDHNG